jgi:hypothetical protein
MGPAKVFGDRVDNGARSPGVFLSDLLGLVGARRKRFFVGHGLTVSRETEGSLDLNQGSDPSSRRQGDEGPGFVRRKPTASFN